MHAVAILGVLAAFGLLFLSLLAFCAARGFRPLAGVRRFYGRLSALGRILLLVFVGAFIGYASTKSDGDERSTNAPPARMAAQRRSLAVQPGVVISEAETNLGYRVLAVRDGDEIVPPGIESVTNVPACYIGGVAPESGCASARGLVTWGTSASARRRNPPTPPVFEPKTPPLYSKDLTFLNKTAALP